MDRLKTGERCINIVAATHHTLCEGMTDTSQLALRSQSGKRVHNSMRTPVQEAAVFVLVWRVRRACKSGGQRVASVQRGLATKKVQLILTMAPFSVRGAPASTFTVESPLTST